MADVSELRVHLQPRASRSEVTGWREGALAVRLTAPPVEGAANKACRDFLAEFLGVRRADVELVSGEKSREKRVRISGLSEVELARRITARLP
ncbi:MAG TPA: DUF167 domain-containing protein [Armatimonadota bacterium]|nr:DUF167 domain-containing protein [Armatimonadota bacterium]